MQRLSRVISSVLAIGLAVSMFSGCGNEQKAQNASNSSTQQQGQQKNQPKTKIKVWTQSRADQNYMVPSIEKYNKENTDGIEIEYQMYTDNYLQTLDMAFATNEAPDIIQDSVNAMVKYIPMGYLEPLDKYLTPEYKNRFGPGAFLETINIFDGKIYSLPAFGTTARLFYNKGIFEKAGIKAPPKTLTEMAETAKTITDKLKSQGIYGYAINLKSPASALGRSIDYIVERSGGVRSGYDFGAGKYEFASYKPVLQAYREMFAQGSTFPGCENLDIDPLRTQFAAGKIGMYISWTHAEPGVYANQFPTKENWDVAQIPTVDGTAKGSQNIWGGTWYCMSSKSKNLDKAWKVMQFIYSDELQGGYHENGLGVGMIPTALAKAKQPETLKKWPELAMTNNDKLWPLPPLGVTPEGQDMYLLMAAYILNSKEVNDADKLINDLNTRYNAAFTKAVAEGKTKKLQYNGFDSKDPAKALQK